MTTSTLRQNIPLTVEGQTISIQWLRMLQGEFARVMGGSTASSSVSAVDFAALSSLVADYGNKLDDLSKRVAALEKGGYQS